MSRTCFRLFLILLFWYCPLQALETWTLVLEPELKSLSVRNQTSETQVLQFGSDAVEIPAQETSEISLLPFQQDPALVMKALRSHTFSLNVSSSSNQTFKLYSGSSTVWKAQMRNESELVLFNSSPFEQSIRLAITGQKNQDIKLKDFEKKRVFISKSLLPRSLNVTGAARFSALLLSRTGSQALAPEMKPVVMPEALNPPEGLHYFEVSNSAKSESYILALSDPAQVTQAQNQVLNSLKDFSLNFSPRILIAKVAYGSGGFNRDLSSLAKVPWSWHVEKLVRFADLASQECNGSPQQLEENLKAVVESSGIICFWNYRIVRELSPSEVSRPLN